MSLTWAVVTFWDRILLLVRPMALLAGLTFVRYAFFFVDLVFFLVMGVEASSLLGVIGIGETYRNA